MISDFEKFGINVPPHAGGETHTTCPQCSPQRKKKLAKCLSVNVDKGVWCCHHCGWGGSLEKGPEGSGQRHWNAPKYREPMARTDLAANGQGLAWLESRGISKAVADRNQIAYGTVYMPQVEEHVGAIIFPFLRKGKVVNRKYRDNHKNFRGEVGCERTWFGLDDAADVTIIVEGEMDKLSCEVAGFKNCMSVPDGAPSPKSKDYSAKFDFLENCREDLQHVKKWVLAVDSDEPGQVLEDELSRRLGRENCFRVRWPKGCKDANDVLLEYGKERLSHLLSSPEPFPIHGTFSFDDIGQKIIALYERGLEKGFSTGWTDLDRFYTVRPGEMTVVTGIPNSGKSNWLDALTVNLAHRHGWSFGVCSPENHPIEDHAARFIEKWSGKPFDKGPTERMDDVQVVDGISWCNDHFRFIALQDEIRIDKVLSVASQLVFRYGIKGLVIDPWNEFEHDYEGGKTETQYISETLTVIRHWARKHAVHVWLVVHPQKLLRDKDGNYPVPTLYDCAGSAHWRNKADNGISIWRDFRADTPIVEVHIQKIRFKQIGRQGMAQLEYDRVTGRYSDLSDGRNSRYGS